MRFLIGMFCVLFALLSWEAKAQEVVILKYIYCQDRVLMENLGRLYKEGGYAAANTEFAALLDRADGHCFGSTDELPLYILLRGVKYRSDGSYLQVMGVSDKQFGEPTLWTIIFGRDGST